MKLLYEKGIPFLLGITLAIQEMVWGKLPVSFVVIILSCLLAMVCLMAFEKKQWNVLFLIALATVCIVCFMHLQDKFAGKFCYWYYVMFSIQYLVLAITAKYVYVKSVLSFSLLISLVIVRLYKVSVLPVLICLILFLVIVSISELVHVSYYKKGLENKQTVGLLPVFLILFFVLFISPVKQEPFDWSFLIKPFVHAYENVCIVVENIKDSCTEQSKYFSFQLYKEGKDNEKSLGGEVNLSKKVLLEVKKSQNIQHTIYLNGSVYDTYTGAGWKKEKGKSKQADDEYKLARKEIEWACNNEGWNTVKDESVLYERMLTIKYGRIKTKTAFYPDYLEEIQWRAQGTKLLKHTSNISFSNTRKRGYEYKVFYKDINLNSKYIEKYLATLDTFEFKDRDLRKRAEDIKKEYKKLPETLPEDVIKLSAQIANEETNSYDKMIAICKYLRNYQYTEKVEDIADGEDFVDDFLYRTKKGYCTYFASAAAVMGRCVGIPTRYVEGMILTKDCNQKKGYYMLDGKCMHAWCEAYFEGFGWVIFEATPGYVEVKDVWKKHSIKNYYEKTPVKTSLQPTEQLVEQKDIRPQPKADYRYFIAGGIFFASVVLFLSLKIFLGNRIKIRTKKERCNQLFAKMLFYLKKMGMVREKGETLTEFCIRVKSDMLTTRALEQELLLDSVNVFMKMCFGKEEPKEEELDILEEMLMASRKLYRERKGKARYYVMIIEETFVK